MNTLSRFIGCHKLFLLNFYPHLQKYLQPHQKNVTAVLVYLAQATHELVPPEVLEPCVRTLASHFVTDRCSGPVMTVGLNAIRELCARQPLAMDGTLLQDLALYKISKDKGVMMAARSLIALFRDQNPELLHKRDRGKALNMARSAAVAAGQSVGRAAPTFGQQQVATDVLGAELLRVRPRECCCVFALFWLECVNTCSLGGCDEPSYHSCGENHHALLACHQLSALWHHAPAPIRWRVL